MKTQNMKTRLLCLGFAAALLWCAAAGCKKAPGPEAVKTVWGEDLSRWEQVSLPGFGNRDNGGIVAMAEFQDRLYAVTRNDVSGFEIWRTADAGWEQVSVPGLTDSVLHSRMINVWSDMIVFQDRLYLAVSSGYQGSKLYKSIGFEIWRFDGETWEPAVSHARGAQVTGAISAIAGCAAADGSPAAEFTDDAAQWAPDQLKGGILWITSGAGMGRAFEIAGNTATTLTVQQNETAGKPEDTVCAEQSLSADPPFPKYTIGAVSAGDSYKIIQGITANGFGELWNKGIVDFEIYGDELYASVGFNYEKGARIWKSADGMVWAPSSPYSMGSYHGYDAEGNPTGVCLVAGQEARNGQPVSSSLPKFGKLEKDGQEILVIGGTGTQGCNGRGLRLFRLYDDGWKPIVDHFIDANDTGTNENGIGDDGGDEGFIASNFQAWSWAMHDGNLFAGIGRLIGGRVMHTPNAEPEDGNWSYAVGGDAILKDGFGYPPNIAFNLLSYTDATMIAGSIDEESMTAEYVKQDERGADLWRAAGPAGSLRWTRITGNGFGDHTIVQFDALRKFFGDQFYVAASSFGPSTPFPTTPTYGAREGYSGAIVYRLASKLP